MSELRKREIIKPFTKLISTFLGHFKSNGFSVDQVKERAFKLKILDARIEAFLNVFLPFYERYEQKLRDENAIDFNDMIIEATKMVDTNKYISPYSCILVDEFQDISVGRAKLLSKLSHQKSWNRLFCVGDDWQAIYRFAGSDITLMRNFESHFGFTETLFLDTTFRFNDKIEAVATKFILKNPAQLTKTIKTLKKDTRPRVTIHFPKHNSNSLINAITLIYRENKNASVLLLGRYDFSKINLPWQKIKTIFPELMITFKTIHKAKGSEADYVIVLGISTGKHGFPSEIVDDPILNTVLSEPESFQYAEERRLFYVALTRSREAVHLISDTPFPSEFLSEIMIDKEYVEVMGNVLDLTEKCPFCKTGDMQLLSGKNGNYYRCSNHPLCRFTANASPQKK